MSLIAQRLNELQKPASEPPPSKETSVREKTFFALIGGMILAFLLIACIVALTGFLRNH